MSINLIQKVKEHKCKDFCAICSPIRSLEMILYRAIQRQRYIKIRAFKFQ